MNTGWLTKAVHRFARLNSPKPRGTKHFSLLWFPAGPQSYTGNTPPPPNKQGAGSTGYQKPWPWAICKCKQEVHWKAEYNATLRFLIS